MAQSCPISFETVDSTITRLNTLSISVVLVVFLSTLNPLWLYLIFFDFMMRLYGCSTLSFSDRISRSIKSLFRLKGNSVDAAAKRLAAHFGLGLVLVMIAAFNLQLPYLLYTCAGIFLLCLLIDLLFDYCIGCKVYFIIKFFFPKAL